MTERHGPAANVPVQKHLRRREKDRLRQQRADLRAVMSTPAGRRFIWRLIDEVAGVFGPSWTGSSETFYREGRRAVGIDLMREVQRTCPAEYVHALNEELAARASEEVERKAVESTAEGEE